MPGKPALLAAVDGRPRHPRRRAGALARLRSRRPQRYDLVIPNAYLEDEKILLLLDIIRSDEFKEKALAMGDYEMHETGNVVNQILTPEKKISFFSKTSTLKKMLDFK